MLLFFTLTAFLCCSTLHGNPWVSLIYSDGVDEHSCKNMFSWTDWHNISRINDFPSMAAGLSVMQMSKIGGCEDQQGMQIQVRTEVPAINYDPMANSWAVIYQLLATFQSYTPSFHFQIRLCCSNSTTNSIIIPL